MDVQRAVAPSTGPAGGCTAVARVGVPSVQRPAMRLTLQSQCHCLYVPAWQCPTIQHSIVSRSGCDYRRKPASSCDTAGSTRGIPSVRSPIGSSKTSPYRIIPCPRRTSSPSRFMPCHAMHIVFLASVSMVTHPLTTMSPCQPFICHSQRHLPAAVPPSSIPFAVIICGLPWTWASRSALALRSCLFPPWRPGSVLASSAR